MQHSAGPQGDAEKTLYEEFHPYGTSAYRAFQSSEVSDKRYRYTGKEKDEETKLYYYGARYLAPWLGRWMSPDPQGLVDGPGLYNYVRGSPVVLSDPSGTQGQEEVPMHLGQGGIGRVAELVGHTEEAARYESGELVGPAPPEPEPAKPSLRYPGQGSEFTVPAAPAVDPRYPDPKYGHLAGQQAAAAPPVIRGATGEVLGSPVPPKRPPKIEMLPSAKRQAEGEQLLLDIGWGVAITLATMQPMSLVPIQRGTAAVVVTGRASGVAGQGTRPALDPKLMAEVEAALQEGRAVSTGARTAT
ncbi:MAG: hypothetical protein DRI90_04890, partial [Deltaproteobacteria bacterium]